MPQRGQLLVAPKERWPRSRKACFRAGKAGLPNLLCAFTEEEVAEEAPEEEPAAARFCERCLLLLLRGRLMTNLSILLRQTDRQTDRQTEEIRGSNAAGG
jgi:hypothetical protein